MRDEGASSESSAARPPSGAIQGGTGSPSTTADGRVGPGWYADPNTEGQLRYWDGQVWTAAVAAISDAKAPPQHGTDGKALVEQPQAGASKSGRVRKSRRGAWALPFLLLLIPVAAGVATAIIVRGDHGVHEGCTDSGCTDSGQQQSDVGDDSSGEVDAGVNLITVPNVVGMNSFGAAKQLRDLGFQVTDYGVGGYGSCRRLTVISQSPTGGETAATGSLVSIGHEIVPCAGQ